jgi:hypothetical protein
MTKDKTRDLIDPKVSEATMLKFCAAVGACPAPLT